MPVPVDISSTSSTRPVGLEGAPDDRFYTLEPLRTYPPIETVPVGVPVPSKQREVPLIDFSVTGGSGKSEVDRSRFIFTRQADRYSIIARNELRVRHLRKYFKDTHDAQRVEAMCETIEQQKKQAREDFPEWDLFSRYVRERVGALYRWQYVHTRCYTFDKNGVKTIHEKPGVKFSSKYYSKLFAAAKAATNNFKDVNTVTHAGVLAQDAEFNSAYAIRYATAFADRERKGMGEDKTLGLWRHIHPVPEYEFLYLGWFNVSKLKVMDQIEMFLSDNSSFYANTRLNLREPRQQGAGQVEGSDEEDDDGGELTPVKRKSAPSTPKTLTLLASNVQSAASKSSFLAKQSALMRSSSAVANRDEEVRSPSPKRARPDASMSFARALSFARSVCTGKDDFEDNEIKKTAHGRLNYRLPIGERLKLKRNQNFNLEQTRLIVQGYETTDTLETIELRLKKVYEELRTSFTSGDEEEEHPLTSAFSYVTAERVRAVYMAADGAERRQDFVRMEMAYEAIGSFGIFGPILLRLVSIRDVLNKFREVDKSEYEEKEGATQTTSATVLNAYRLKILLHHLRCSLINIANTIREVARPKGFQSHSSSLPDKVIQFVRSLNPTVFGPLLLKLPAGRLDKPLLRLTEYWKQEDTGTSDTFGKHPSLVAWAQARLKLYNGYDRATNVQELRESTKSTSYGNAIVDDEFYPDPAKRLYASDRARRANAERKRDHGLFLRITESKKDLDDIMTQNNVTNEDPEDIKSNIQAIAAKMKSTEADNTEQTRIARKCVQLLAQRRADCLYILLLRQILEAQRNEPQGAGSPPDPYDASQEDANFSPPANDDHDDDDEDDEEEGLAPEVEEEPEKEDDDYEAEVSGDEDDTMAEKVSADEVTTIFTNLRDYAERLCDVSLLNLYPKNADKNTQKHFYQYRLREITRLYEIIDSMAHEIADEWNHQKLMSNTINSTFTNRMTAIQRSVARYETPQNDKPILVDKLWDFQFTIPFQREKRLSNYDIGLYVPLAKMRLVVPVQRGQGAGGSNKKKEEVASDEDEDEDDESDDPNMDSEGNTLQEAGIQLNDTLRTLHEMLSKALRATVMDKTRNAEREVDASLHERMDLRRSVQQASDSVFVRMFEGQEFNELQFPSFDFPLSATASDYQAGLIRAGIESKVNEGRAEQAELDEFDRVMRKRKQPSTKAWFNVLPARKVKFGDLFKRRDSSVWDNFRKPDTSVIASLARKLGRI